MIPATNRQAHETDDRILCRDCRHGQGTYCQQLNIPTRASLLHRCQQFSPLEGAADQRAGAERWPNLLLNIQLARSEQL